MGYQNPEPFVWFVLIDQVPHIYLQHTDSGTLQQISGTCSNQSNLGIWLIYKKKQAEQKVPDFGIPLSANHDTQPAVTQRQRKCNLSSLITSLRLRTRQKQHPVENTQIKLALSGDKRRSFHCCQPIKSSLTLKGISGVFQDPCGIHRSFLLNRFSHRFFVI